MASSSSPLFFATSLSSSSSSSSSLVPGLLRLGNPCTRFHPNVLQPLGATQSPAEGRPESKSSDGSAVVKRTTKHRPSFYKQTVERWSLRIESQREKFPWQVEKELEDVRGVVDGGGGVGNDVKDAGFGLGGRRSQDPWDQGGIRGGTRFGCGSKSKISSKQIEYNGRRNAGGSYSVGKKSFRNEEKVVAGDSTPVVYLQEEGASSTPWVRGLKSRSTPLDAGAETQMELKGSLELGSDASDAAATQFSHARYKDSNIPVGKADAFGQQDHAMQTPTPQEARLRDTHFKYQPANRHTQSSGIVTNGDAENAIVQEDENSFIQKRDHLNLDSVQEEESVSGTCNVMHNVTLPWKSDDSHGGRSALCKRSNTQLAERTIPEPELRRLRNVALRTKERTKVGSAGVTEALVQTIREKWKEAEIVKLKFEGPPAINMKRTHEILESRTGGLVIWRSGSSLVLYRKMTYKLPCVKSYSELVGSKHTLLHPNDSTGNYNKAARDDNSLKYVEIFKSDMKSSFLRASHEFIDESNIDGLLDELGPRYMDWSGRKPLPVDADSLPPVILGYKPPLRLLPFRAKTALRNTEMTYLRRLARSMPPHFALGRNKNHQGLAKAMVKLWEKSIIAKIAIKRGVPNTCNDRMAEELRVLTGGVLLSRNKEFIVFYRGNDFLAPSVAKVVADREKFADIRQDEEEQARQRALECLVSDAKLPQARHLAGTLAETLEAKAHWADGPNNDDREQMMKDNALAKHASLIRFMEKKLCIAKEKVKRAEEALAKVQRSLDPAELPTDLETVTDEERFLFRKMGLKMRGFLSLGRRGVFDGTIENMHLNWKHHELVKIIIKGKSFAQVKQIAISLEAESGGVLISLDKTTKGYAVIVYRGKNYQQPHILRPRNLLTKRQALERSIELQRREALKYHISNLTRKVETMKSELEQMERQEITDSSTCLEMNDAFSSFDDDNIEEEGEEAYLETYDMVSDVEDAEQ